MFEETLLTVEGTQSRSAIAARIRSVIDQLEGDGPVAITGDDRTVTVRPPDDLDFELEVEREREDDASSELSVEFEIEWTEPADEERADASTVAEGTTGEDDAAPAGPAESVESLGRFQLYTDRAGEWRWRLVHRNGNIIATSGEGYSSRRNAEKGMKSVMRNAPGADVIDG